MKIRLKGIASNIWLSLTKPTMRQLKENQCEVWAEHLDPAEINDYWFFAVKQDDMKPLVDKAIVIEADGSYSYRPGSFMEIKNRLCLQVGSLQALVYKVDMATGMISEYSLIGVPDENDSVNLQMAMPSTYL